ncbi:deleted in malignant brain tumors 1 protein-like [Pangasianodon hypophthalmus]|uniref:deleted in malignant brain tumors 1 protein-like n=1 Tax=Pangasianodon hypophthalmus TaxID=310915 RepID=UPI002307D16F|nr:deleted in malignant brain tumors 1 protein-like [Pangasianodon hypophthalmus]
MKFGAQFLALFICICGSTHFGQTREESRSDGASCGGILTQSKGELFSPNFPRNYPNNAECTWRLQGPEQKVVSLTFTFVDLESKWDSVHVYDGLTDEDPQLGVVTANQTNSFTSSSRYMTVIFSSDESWTQKGFRAEWAFIGGDPCGGDLTQSQGEFFSPNFPNNYPEGTNCTWRLVSPEQQVVSLTFVSVDIESCLGCGCDAVRVYDGPSTSSLLLGTVCGYVRKTFSSSSNTLTVVFSSDNSVNRRGFIAHWNFTGGDPCGGDLTQSQGEFFSPNFPNNYPEGTNCTWRLVSPEQQVVSLTFVSVDIESCLGCGCDAVRVYDGPSTSSLLLGTVCGYVRKTFSSSSNTLTVVFSSDNSVNRRGFIAHWNFTGGDPCGGDLTQSQGEFFSPNFPNNYPEGTNCTWRLVSPEQQVVSLTFVSVDIESCLGCGCDAVRVYDGPSTSSLLLGTVCGYGRKTFSSSSNTLTVFFSSDNSVNQRGFIAHWNFTDGGACGGILTQSKGEFFSPNFPLNYPNNAECTWRLQGPEQKVVSLTFTFVDLESNWDSVDVYDGLTDEDPHLGAVTQTNSFNSSSRYMTVTFSSDWSVTQQGFRAEWAFIDSPSCRYNCGNNLSVCSCTSDCQDNRNCCYDYNGEKNVKI